MLEGADGLDPVLAPLAAQRPGVDARRVATAAFLVLGLVGLGKIAGFAREVTVVAQFGASASTDGFFTAYALFNIVWVMALATSLAPALVPSLARIDLTGDAGRRRRVAGSFAAVGLGLASLLALVAFAFAEPIIALTAPDLSADARRTGVDSLRLLALAVVPIVGAGVLGAILQAHDRFAAAAASTLIVSLSMVACTVGLGGALGVQAASVGLVVGSVLQLLVLLPDLMAVRPIARPSRADAADVQEAGRRVGPVSTLAGLVALRPAMERSFAADLGTGLLTLVGLGSRTGSFFPHLVGTALATAIFPHLSRAAASGDEEGVARTVRFGVSFTVLTSLPVAVAVFLFSGDLAAVLFRHGSVTDVDAGRIAVSMAAYAFAIVLAPLVDLLARVRYARGDATSPLIATGLGLVANGAVIVAAPRLGLAAFGIGFTINVVLVMGLLGARERSLLRSLVPDPRILAVAAAGTTAAVAIYLVIRGGPEAHIARLLMAIAAAGLSYLGVLVAVTLARGRLGLRLPGFETTDRGGSGR
jgi:putative peptidoglycan lipid II flippase